MFLDCTRESFGLKEVNGQFHELLEVNTTIPTKKDKMLNSLQKNATTSLVPGFMTPGGVFMALAPSVDIPKDNARQGLKAIVDFDGRSRIKLSLWGIESDGMLCEYAIDPNIGKSRLRVIKRSLTPPPSKFIFT